MSLPLLEAPVRWWRCPSCGATDRTEKPGFITQMHPCPALGDVTIPLVEVSGPDAAPDGRQVPVMREDYAAGANPLTAIRTERGDGSNDVTIFAETAVIDLRQ